MYSHKQKGIGLIEVLVALLISVIGIIGLLALQSQTLKTTQDNGSRSQAIWVFNDIVNRIRANELNFSNYETDGVSCPASNLPPGPVCSSYSDGNTIHDAADCNGENLAAFDLWEAICSNKGENDTQTSAADFLLQPELTISCDITDCPINSSLTITLSWASRTNPEVAQTISEVIYP